jgi:hypothetical protein
MIFEAQLYYYKARVYDPIFGRFLQTDPIGSKDDLDLYAYVGDDPVDKDDPTGNCPTCGSAVVGGIVGGVVGGGLEIIGQLATKGEVDDWGKLVAKLQAEPWAGL